MLTRKQHELLLYIDARLAETGVSPSFEAPPETSKVLAFGATAAQQYLGT